MKRAVICVILCSMMLHCASRVGFLSYLYQHRHEIAFSLGLINEVPIATCSSDYDFGDGLVVRSVTEDGASQRTLPIAIEINLFFVSDKTQVPSQSGIQVSQVYAPLQSNPRNGCLRSVFHPPAQRA